MNAKQLMGILLTIGMLATASHRALGEERTVQAMAPWQGSGEVFSVATRRLFRPALGRTGSAVCDRKCGDVLADAAHCGFF